MPKKPTNTELAKQIEHLEGVTERRFTDMHATITELQRKIQPFHDYLVGQKAIAESRANSNSSLLKDVVKIVSILAAVIAALVGVNSI